MPQGTKAKGRWLRGWPADPVLGVLAAACCLVIIAAGLSCSDSDGAVNTPAGTPAKNAPPKNIITDADVSATRRGSPERVLFEFFQAVQFQDIEAIRPLVTRSSRQALGPGRLAKALSVVGPAVGKPHVFEVRRTGDRATVRLLLQGFAAGRDNPVSSQPFTFSLIRSNGVWRLNSLAYLVTTANDISGERRRPRGP